MEAKGCSQRWKMHLPEFKHSRRCLSTNTGDGERGKTQRETDRGGPHKSVSLAPTSRYLTDRQYVMRKPLFSAEQHTSILKKTHLQKQKDSGVSRGEHTDLNFLTRPREELTPQSFSLSHRDVSPPSASSEDLSSPLGVSELRGRLYHEEPTFGSPFSASRSAQRSLSSSFLEVQRLNPPLRPQLTSTVLNPTYTPRSGYTRPGHMEEKGGEKTRLFSSGGHSKGEPMSPYQANYWACAIPKALPPSPDRHSAAWDPNREYQALLDYTYPLRPGHVVSEWDSSELQGDSHLQADLQDSGIEVDHLCSSTSLSGVDFSVNSTGLTRERSPLGAGQSSPDLPGFTRSSDGLPTGTPLSLTDPVGLSLNSLDCSKDRGGLNRHRSDDDHHRQHHAPSSSTSTAFIRTTSVLPQPGCVCGETDEEFWRLPEQLEELQLLSRQVREVTAQLSRPVAASWESLEPGTTSILSSITFPEKQEADDEEKEGDSQDTEEGKDEPGREERNAAQTSVDHRDSEAVRRTSGAWVEPVGGGLSRSSLREVEALVQQLSGLSLPGSQRSSQENQEQRDSLMQHIQVFCSHLEQLIQRLYTMSEKMELLTAPAVDIDSVKSSLAEYQSFQREVSSHQPLTSCVLLTGQLLLSCINTTSPLLRDTLLLIERQSGALQTYTEHLFSSILSAMDTLTQPPQPSQPSPVQQSTEEDLHPVDVQGSAS
ncbi:centrosomal protein of 68 kDa isoform X2 [Toxotes jaculatrix]|uniref:centrosomal protein of 68 kDa isoform X2 n=1 Tax=Toxotes jaculatrix TaxID=941984 RepID=UPI001B3AEF92|nr:centrosomal protein of 68 kDa isoform X2 [Toxotes jaculatrix]